jgi:DNA repair exonuclease SbcCD ATPase subunit
LLNLTTNTKQKGKSGRDPADIRKIEELKKELSEVHESIAKRYPDSLATLIQASKLSDSVQVETKRREKELQDAKEELVKSKEEFERRLRSLRQEHEKIKFQYEERIKNLQNTTATKSNNPSSLKSTTDAGQMNSNGNYKNLTVANSKIKELEKEIERIRLFYTKKVEETQRRADNQMRAIKRGDNNIDNEENKLHHGDGDGDSDNHHDHIHHQR